MGSDLPLIRRIRTHTLNRRRCAPNRPAAGDARVAPQFAQCIFIWTHRHPDAQWVVQRLRRARRAAFGLGGGRKWASTLPKPLRSSIKPRRRTAKVFQIDRSVLPEASQLFAESHRWCRVREPLLPVGFENADAALAELDGLSADSTASGVARREGSRLIGYLIGASRAGSHWGPNVWIGPAVGPWNMRA